MADELPKQPIKPINPIHKFIRDQQDPAITQQVYQRVAQILTKDEEICYIAVQTPLVSLSPDSVVLTNRRFIIYKPKLLGGVDFVDYVWRELRDVHLNEGMLHSSLSFSTVKEKYPVIIGNLPKAQARKLYAFAQEMEERMIEERRIREMEEKRAAAGGITIQNPGSAAAPPPPAMPKADDPIQKLTQLKAMLDAGLITQQEYDAKKTELLSRM